MGLDPSDLEEGALAFLAERHLATLTTLRPDGSPHVVAVGFTFDPDTGVARVICQRSSHKARHVAANPGGRAVVAQVDGSRWLALEGRATIDDTAAGVAEAVRRYAARYRTPQPNPERVAIVIAVDRVLGRG